MNDFDFLLRRPILDGRQFDSLIPASECQILESGNGNTELSMEWIKEMSLEFHPQMQKVAKVLQKDTLQKTCEKIHWFAYNHFQYMADDDDQMMRSPSCSWTERQTGIDCKSYSIVASAILLNLELKHYIRKIKQPSYAPTEWTHVYVVVPKNQTTGSLKDGYYTIDGTIMTVAEPTKIQNKDLYMNHNKLNGASGLNAFKLDDIKGFMSGLSCIGGSAYTGDLYKSNVEKIVDFFNQNIAGVNAAISSNDMQLLSTEANEIIGMAKLMDQNFFTKKGQKSWNSCTNANFSATIDLARFYRYRVAVALEAYLDNYFNKVANGTVIFTDAGSSSLNIWALDGTTFQTVNEPKFIYSVKTGVTSIPKFEITPYVAATLQNPANINIQEFLGGLSSIIKTFSGSGSNTGGVGTNNGSYPVSDGGSYNQPINDNQIQTAGGAGSIVGWLFIAGAFGYAFTQMKDKPATATASKRIQKSPVKK